MLLSVMIPTYNPDPKQLEQMLQSVLSQDPGPEVMQIEIVDDCSPAIDVEKIVRAQAADRIHISRTPANQGLAGCWNSCIDRAKAEWVHILHQDDYVLPGFYREIESAIRLHADVGLIAVRSFYVDEDSVITAVTPRLRSLEQGNRDVRELFYDNPLQFPGVVVRKSAYEKHGYFRTDLSYTLDWEMWTRIISEESGVVSPQVLACYRISTRNMSNRLARTGDTLADRTRINRIFAERYHDFDQKLANRHLCEVALLHAQLFKKSGDEDAAHAHLKYWKRNASLSEKVRRYGGAAFRRITNALS